MALTFLFLTLFVLFAGAAAISESHTIRFDNQCGKGTPQLIIGGRVVSNGSDYTSQGPASSGIAYLQTGSCLFNGENCAIVEFTLGNPTCAGCGSSTDISLIAPHQLNVPTGFSYFNGCDGVGATCTTPECNAAFFNPNDNQVQVACQSNNVGLLISFCPNGEATPSSPSSSPTYRQRRCQLRAAQLQVLASKSLFLSDHRSSSLRLP
ncbi:hypothetical protein BV25DRAFT_1876887 [Artomyces pyxidatus]|uniref:Uncharacterized protein n=1 Tax=Artomyces pyxidatus TaxID=48021 RepID=A0ACB8TFE0_9AGAM|nr:hypothetical protein BV25DRAFT_1876887 [Artomyces pyxidatus]